MNVFYLSDDPLVSAMALIKKHKNKMLIESAQLLCTAHRVLDGELFYAQSKNGRRLKRWKLKDTVLDDTLYLATHVNHPSAIWVRESAENYVWLLRHAVALANIYKLERDKKHKTHELVLPALMHLPKNIPQTAKTEPPQAMPDEYKASDPIVGYRAYYEAEKLKLGTDADRKLYFEALTLNV